MILEYVKQWEENKGLLQKSFEDNLPESYEDIYKRLFELVVTNPTFRYSNEWNWKTYRLIDDGDYQGHQIFVLASNVYQPSLWDYIFTDVSYGSCSGCDTFEHIEYSGKSKEEQVKEFMTLALHMVQETKTFNSKEQ
jgi:hypothetical protein